MKWIMHKSPFLQEKLSIVYKWLFQVTDPKKNSPSFIRKNFGDWVKWILYKWQFLEKRNSTIYKWLFQVPGDRSQYLSLRFIQSEMNRKWNESQVTVSQKKTSHRLQVTVPSRWNEFSTSDRFNRLQMTFPGDRSKDKFSCIFKGKLCWQVQIWFRFYL